jgi:hypothetical protein
MEALFEFFFVLVGKLVVPILTFGRWRGERLSTDEYKIHSAAGAVSFFVDGKRVISHIGLLFVGVFTTIAIIVASFVLYGITAS